MNPKLFVACLLFILTFSSLQAKIWRVNNNDQSADFTDTDIAHDSNQVGNGDTLYVEGSVDNYTSFNCTKALIIIGPGYFLLENLPSANFFPARINEINFQPGSEGAKVIGMTFDIFSSSKVNVYTDFISIERCYLNGGIDLGDVSGIRIIGNYLLRVDDRFSDTVFDQVFFNNNIVTGNMSLNQNAGIITCYNNIFLGNSFSFRVLEFRNNILVNNSVTLNLNSSFIERNIATNNVLGGDNINVNNINALFVGGDSPDGQYQLSANSLAEGAGYEGVDCGIFGGDTPYLISGLPPLPIISVLEVDDAANEQTGLKVKIKVISNE